MLMLTDKAYVKDLFEVRTETAIENLEMLNNYLGDKISIICLDGTDYGSQRGELFSPEIFEEVYMPFMKLQTKWIHDRSDWKILQHSCGSITQMIPLMIKSGIDILNPVQTSAKSMDPVWLKQNFGDRLVFWGGGVDTQKTLPFGSARDVEKEVEEQVGIFAPGGGYVFGAIHNIQQGTPPENIVAAYNAALKAGSYPIK
jgi:uroporphyrinogen-III decarboxylase